MVVTKVAKQLKSVLSGIQQITDEAEEANRLLLEGDPARAVEWLRQLRSDCNTLQRQAAGVIGELELTESA